MNTPPLAFDPRHALNLFQRIPIDAFAEHSDGDTWRSSPLFSVTDKSLIEAVIVVLTPPKLNASSSFILHAPLELAARAALLPMVAADGREAARRRIAELAVRYVHAGDAVAAPTQAFSHIDDAFSALHSEIATQDVEAADTAITYLIAHANADELRARLIDPIAPLLSAAGHAPILLAALPALDQTFIGARGLLRAPVRALAKSSHLRLTWHAQQREYPLPDDAPAKLYARLAAPPRLRIESNSIAPTVLAVERSGDAVRLLAPLIDSLTIVDARRVLLRIAAWSMLLDDPSNAPYGWTHCLTLPQALLQNSGVSRNPCALVAIAATEVLGIRAPEGNTDLPVVEPSIPFSAIPTVEELANFAATHRDAHVAKYTLACFQAAHDDPDATPLFMAAAAHLQQWWRTRGK